MRRDEKIIARPQDARLRLAFDQEPGRPGKHQHPLGPVLVVPEPGRARVSGRNDALDPQVFGREQRDYLLGVEVPGERGKQISAVAGYRLAPDRPDQATLLTVPPTPLRSVWSAAALACASACTRLSAACSVRLARFW